MSKQLFCLILKRNLNQKKSILTSHNNSWKPPSSGLRARGANCGRTTNAGSSAGIPWSQRGWKRCVNRLKIRNSNRLQYPKVDQKWTNLQIWGFRGIYDCWPSPHLSLATPAFGTCSGSITQHTCACVRFFLVGNSSLNHMFTRLNFLGMLNVKLFTSAESHLTSQLVSGFAFVECTSCFCAMTPSYLYVLGMSRHHMSRYTHGMAKTPNKKT